MEKKLTLRKMAEAINKKTGSRMFSEEMGKPCLEFYYKKIIVDGWNLIDADEMAHLNTIMGYNLDMETVSKLRTDLWEHDIDVLELNRNEKDRKLIEESAARCEIKLDWSKWKNEPIEVYEYFQEE